MKRTVIGVAATALLVGGCTQPAIQNVVHKGDRFYGRDGTVTAELEKPLYSDRNRADQPSEIAGKYRSETHQYSVAAQVPEIEADTLPAPQPVQVSEPSAPVGGPMETAAQPAPRQDDQQDEPQPLAALPMTLPEPGTTAAGEPQARVSTGSASEDTIRGAGQAVKQPPRLEPLNERHSNFIWPVEGNVVSRFGPKQSGLVNDGINIAAPGGEPIWAAAKGEVVYAGNELKGYGNMLIIRHANGWMTAYAHTSDTLVDKGDRVEQGDLIGYVGKTGSVTEAQLHFGVRSADGPIDPETLLPRRVASAD